MYYTPPAVMLVPHLSVDIDTIMAPIYYVVRCIIICTDKWVHRTVHQHMHIQSQRQTGRHRYYHGHNRDKHTWSHVILASSALTWKSFYCCRIRMTCPHVAAKSLSLLHLSLGSHSNIKSSASDFHHGTLINSGYFLCMAVQPTPLERSSALVFNSAGI